MLKLKRACGQYYGTAGPAFIQLLINEYSNSNALSNLVKTLIDIQTKKRLPKNAIPEQERAIRRMALIEAAGILAIEYNILPFSNDEIHTAIKTVMNAWLRGGTSLPDGIKGAMAVKQFIQRFPTRFYNENSPYMPPSLVGYIDSYKGLILFIPSGFHDVCGGYDEQLTANALKQLGFLRTDANRFQTKHSVRTHGETQRLRVYADKRSLLEYDFTEPTEYYRANGA